MNKVLAHVILIIAIILPICLLAVEPLSLWSFMLYLSCGGCFLLKNCYLEPNAAATKTTRLLACLAKAVFVIAVLAIFIPLIPITWWQLYWLIAVLLIRIASLLVGYLRYHRLAFPATYSNTAKRITFFCFPLLYWSLGFTIAICVFSAAATIAAVEALLINSTAKNFDKTIKSYWELRKATTSI